MSRILFIHTRYPEFDRRSGDVRLSNLLRTLSSRHELALHVLHQPTYYLQKPANKPYADLMQQLGVATSAGLLAKHLRTSRYDMIVIEYWFVAAPIMQEIRVLQPEARILVDTEHVFFYSNQLREAALDPPGRGGDQERRKRAELATYRRADAIITTTDEDRYAVLAEEPAVLGRTIPNIHAMPDAPVGDLAGRRPCSVIFVGNFRNPSNVDAVTWFCAKVLPLLLSRVPSATLRIVGNMPPEEVMALQSPHVEVTGYVPDTAPYLDNSMVSICPLRYGAGLKGKIGEAMSHGLPVVSSAIGIQGMRASLTNEIQVACKPDEWAHAIARLFEDASLWRSVSSASRRYVEAHFGLEAVARLVDEVFADAAWPPIKKICTGSRLSSVARLGARRLLFDGWQRLSGASGA